MLTIEISIGHHHSVVANVLVNINVLLETFIALPALNHVLHQVTRDQKLVGVFLSNDEGHITELNEWSVRLSLLVASD